MGATDMENIERAIIAAAEAGKLRKYVRQHGGTGLAGLIRLADRHTAAATAALKRVAGIDGDYADPRLPRAVGVVRRGI
jgi:hypothetical protein